MEEMDLSCNIAKFRNFCFSKSLALNKFFYDLLVMCKSFYFLLDSALVCWLLNSSVVQILYFYFLFSSSEERVHYETKTKTILLRHL